MNMRIRDLFKGKPQPPGGWHVEPKDGEDGPPNLDQMLIDELRKLVDLKEPRDTRFLLYFSTLAEAEAATVEVRAAGFETEIDVVESAQHEPVRLTASRVMVVHEDTVAEARLLFERVALTHWGDYAGWEAAASF